MGKTTTTTMTIAEAQKRVDAMPAAMSAKGLKKPNARLSVGSNADLNGTLEWECKKGPFNSAYEFIRGEYPAEVLARMETFIAALPPPEETRMKEFMSALSDVIELGRSNGIDVEFINPLTEAMKRLSSNILTDQRAA
jgi:hypothetical protein